ncbi:MAG TPA: hypothetical protein VGB14_13625 [Acidimicrobiales bacterium]
MDPSVSAAQRMLAKVRDFVRDDLDDEERRLFAALVAPGIARAYDDDDTSGFGLVAWRAAAVPGSLVEALRDGGVRVVGL